jgi:hypothetical protein
MIGTGCGTGCWFTLPGGTASLVDLALAGTGCGTAWHWLQLRRGGARRSMVGTGCSGLGAVETRAETMCVLRRDHEVSVKLRAARFRKPKHAYAARHCTVPHKRQRRLTAGSNAALLLKRVPSPYKRSIGRTAPAYCLQRHCVRAVNKPRAVARTATQHW